MPSRRISLSEVGRRNIVYPDVEHVDIKNALKTTEAVLLRLGTLRSTGNGPARRRQLEEQIRRYQAAFAPFKKIPNEIWMYIFELYCQSGRLSTCVKWQPPVVITQVCSAWRQIALSMPKLWSDVHFGENVDLARMWLGRAGNIPRALETTTPQSYISNSNRPQKIQNLICSFPFIKLHITQCDADRIDFMRIPIESLLLLEDLAVLKRAWNSPVLGVTSFSPHHFPNLVSLQMDTYNMPRFHVSRPFATWKNLRRLECKLYRTDWLQETLHDASSLEDCSLLLSELYYSQDLTIENVNLKTLRLSFSYPDSWWSFLDHLTFPNIRTLILIARNSITFRPSHKSSLLRLAPRMGSLTSLTIHYLYVKVDVGLVLQCLSLLQVLELHGKKISAKTANKIGRGELGGCLRELRDWNDCNLFELLQACELRRDVTQGQSQNSSGAIARLEKVSVRNSPGANDCKERICELRKDGIQFEAFGVMSRARAKRSLF